MNEQYVKERIEKYSENRGVYIEFADRILEILKMIIKQNYPELKIASFSRRAKEIESLKKKLSKDKYNENSEITDLAGVRIITYSRKDIEIISKIVKNNFAIDEKNSVDKTSRLEEDKVGYRATHYVVSFDEDRMRMPENQIFKGLKCEIQITSLIAHTWSEIIHEKGYKFEGDLPKKLARRMNLLAGMLELADLELDAYVESYDNYVSKIEKELERGCLKYEINSMSLERFMEWKFPKIIPQVFRDVELILSELKLFELKTIQELNDLIRVEFEQKICKGGWRSLDGIIRNILIIENADKYFSKVWNPSMNQMNYRNYELYQQFGVDIERICKEYKISIIK